MAQTENPTPVRDLVPGDHVYDNLGFALRVEEVQHRKDAVLVRFQGKQKRVRFEPNAYVTRDQA